jgi:ABC-type transport system involved in multi-copper enzyme maturation permease subunit
MRGALRYEWVRISTIGSTYWFYGIALGLTLLITIFVTWGVNSAAPDDFTLVEATTWVITGGASAVIIPVLAAPFCAAIGVLTLGHEYRYGTNKATLTAIPDRYAVLGAKVAVLTLWVLVTVGSILLVNFAIAGLFLNIFDVSGDTVRPVLLYLLYCLGFAYAGFGLSAILRNQTGAMVAVLVYPLVVEPVVNGIMSLLGEVNEGFESLANFLPAAAGRRMMFSPFEEQAGFGQLDTWGVGPSVLMFVVGIALTVAAGATLFIKRDA